MTKLPLTKKDSATNTEIPDTLKKAVEARKDATRKEAEARKLYERLGYKLEGLKGMLPNLKTAIQAAEATRRMMVDKVAMDRAEQSELDRARQRVEEAQRAEAEAREMVEAVEAARSRADEDLSRVVHATQAADRAFWSEVFAHLHGKILEAVGEDFELAWAACIASGQGRVLVDCLVRLLPEERFPRELPREKVREMLDRLDREFGG
ncbi:MAG: hypothetical protein Q8P12_06225 [bacterium]|nr:hypothetical protein [bacterium]